MEDRPVLKSVPRSAASSSHVNTAEPEAESSELLGHGLRVLRRRKKVAILAFLLLMVPASVVIVRQAPRYQATTRLLIERSSEADSVLNEPREAVGQNDFQTQLQVLRSRRLAARTVIKVKLWETDEFKATVVKGTEEEVSAAGLVDAFLAHLTITNTLGTSLLNATFESADPTVAMSAVNALAQAYLDEQAKSQFAESASVVEWLNARLSEQSSSLESSEAALQKYVESQDAVSLQDRQNIVVQRLADLSAAVTRAKTERIGKQALYEQLRSMEDGRTTLEGLPVVLSNSRLQQLRASLTELKQTEARLAQELGDRHPDLVKLRSEIASTEATLQSELARVVDSVKNEFQAAEATERDLTRALEAQKNEVLDLNRKGLEFGALQRQVSGDREVYQKLLSEAQTQGIAGKASPVRIRVVEAAELPRAPMGPSPRRNLALAFFACLILALSAPLTLEALDHRVKTPADLERRLGLRCLAMIPTAAGDKEHGPMFTNEANAFNEGFRRIRTAVVLMSKQSGSTRILVTSAAPREGKSMVASNLALALAQVSRVLLIDGDLRRPKIHKKFGLSPFPGFADLLNGDAGYDEVIRTTSTPNLFVLPCGLKQLSASELLSSPNLETVLEHFDESFDWVVFDTPPVGPVADACIVGQWVKEAIVVLSADSTPMASARSCVEQLAAAHITIAGAILNRVDLQHSAYYYAPYYSGGYGEYYTKPTKSAASTTRRRTSGATDAASAVQ